MEALKRICTHLLILAAATSLFACNLATIDEPLNDAAWLRARFAESCAAAAAGGGAV